MLKKLRHVVRSLSLQSKVGLAVSALAVATMAMVLDRDDGSHLTPLFLLIVAVAALHLSMRVTLLLSGIAGLLHFSIAWRVGGESMLPGWALSAIVYAAMGYLVNRQITGMRELHRHQQELAAISEVSATLTKTLELRELTDLVLDHIFQLFGADGCTILLLNEEQRELRPVAARERRNDPEILMSILQHTVRIGCGLVGWVAATGEPIISGDAERDVRGVHIPGTPFDDESVIGVPLTSEQKVFGVLWIYKLGLDAFGPEDLQLATIFANQVSVALANAQLYESVRRLSETDSLTGLPNSRCLTSLVDAAIAQAVSGSNVSLFFLDCDDFKGVNDRYGHPFGDRFLSNFAAILKKAVRDTDTVIRYAGDEFVIVLPGTNKEGARVVADRLLEAIRAGIMADNPDLRTTASIGLATYPDDASTTEELITRADDALYQAKRGGKNRLAVCSAG